MMFLTKPLGVGSVEARSIARPIASFAPMAKNLVIRLADQGEEEVVMALFLLHLQMRLVEKLERLLRAKHLLALASKR